MKAGMNITLNDGFVEKDIRSYTAYYQSMDVDVFSLKEEAKLFEDFKNITIEDYVGYVSKNNGKEFKLKQQNDTNYFEYTEQTNGKDLSFFPVSAKQTIHFGWCNFLRKPKIMKNINLTLSHGQSQLHLMNNYF